MKKIIATGCLGGLCAIVVMALIGNHIGNRQAAEEYPEMLRALEDGEVAVIEQWYEKHGRLNYWPEESYQRYWHWRLEKAYQGLSRKEINRTVSSDVLHSEAMEAYDKLVERGFGEYRDSQDLMSLTDELQLKHLEAFDDSCLSCDGTGRVRQERNCEGSSPSGCYYGNSATRVYSASGYSHYYCENCHKALQAVNAGGGFRVSRFFGSSTSCNSCDGTGKVATTITIRSKGQPATK